MKHFCKETISSKPWGRFLFLWVLWVSSLLFLVLYFEVFLKFAFVLLGRMSCWILFLILFHIWRWFWDLVALSASCLVGFLDFIRWSLIGEEWNQIHSRNRNDFLFRPMFFCLDILFFIFLFYFLDFIFGRALIGLGWRIGNASSSTQHIPLYCFFFSFFFF